MLTGEQRSRRLDTDDTMGTRHPPANRLSGRQRMEASQAAAALVFSSAQEGERVSHDFLSYLNVGLCSCLHTRRVSLSQDVLKIPKERLAAPSIN